MSADSQGNIVVAVHLNNQWRWFHTELEYWFLDYVAWGEAFGAENNIESTGTYPRDGFDILDRENAAAFLDRISGEELNKELLQEELQGRLPADDWWDVVDLYPRLVVDFDRRLFRSIYDEPASIEDFVPDGWDSQFADTRPFIPIEESFWIVDGKDVFASFMEGTTEN